MDKLRKFLSAIMVMSIISSVIGVIVYLFINFFAALVILVIAIVEILFIQMFLDFVDETILLRDRTHALKMRVDQLERQINSPNASKPIFTKKELVSSKPKATAKPASKPTAIKPKIKPEPILDPDDIDNGDLAAVPTVGSNVVRVNGHRTSDSTVFFTCPHCKTRQNASNITCVECNAPIEYRND